MSAEAPEWESSSRKGLGCRGGGLLQQEVVDGMNAQPSSGRARMEGGCGDLAASSLMAQRTAWGRKPDPDGPAENTKALARRLFFEAW